MDDHLTRYRDYLRRFGISEPEERLVHLRELDLAGISFFAYQGGAGLRLKAAVTRKGIVTPGWHPGDDWYGFLFAMPDAVTASDRLAWLRTDESNPAHALPPAPVTVLQPNRLPPIGMAPAHQQLITASTLVKSESDAVHYTAWFLPAASSVPEYLTVTARFAEPATLMRTSAAELLGNAQEAAAGERARSMLLSSSLNDRLWAVQYVRQTADRAAVPTLVLLLASTATDETTSILAASALGRCGGAESVAALKTALISHSRPPVRRAAAQALGNIHAAEAVQALAESARHEPDGSVRAEVIHALSLQGTTDVEALNSADLDDSEPNNARSSGSDD